MSLLYYHQHTADTSPLPPPLSHQQVKRDIMYDYQHLYENSQVVNFLTTFLNNRNIRLMVIIIQFRRKKEKRLFFVYNDMIYLCIMVGKYVCLTKYQSITSSLYFYVHTSIALTTSNTQQIKKISVKMHCVCDSLVCNVVKIFPFYSLRNCT